MKSYYCQKQKRRKNICIILFFVFVVSFVVCYSVFVITPVIAENTRSKILSLSSSAVSDAVYLVLNQDAIKYEDIVEVKYGKDESVQLVNVDTVYINTLVRKMYFVAQENLNKLANIGIDIALGTFTGIPALVGIGPKINIKVVSVGALNAVFSSNFTSAGINQTKHSISVNFMTSMSLVLPIYNKTIDSSTDFLIADGIIVGDVPEVYLEMGGI